MKTKDTKLKLPKSWERKERFEHVFLNQYGYYELKVKNVQEERKKHFEESYFQEYSGTTYAKTYTDDELAFIRNKAVERAYIIDQNITGIKEGRYSLLDIGCGEGFLLRYFHEGGYKVKGIDIGSYALEHFNPELLPFFEQGDIETLLPQMKLRGEYYDIINMDQVLDMVLDAGVCIQLVKEIMKDTSILVIKVANNYSYLQQSLMESGELQKDYWLDVPDHTGYFNREGLINLLEAYGLECMDFYGACRGNLPYVRRYGIWQTNCWNIQKEETGDLK